MANRARRPWRTRFFEYVGKPMKRGCWNWKGALSDKGYPIFRAPWGTLRAHRISLALTAFPDDPNVALRTVADLAKQLPDVHHKCENIMCVRPEHLEPKYKRDHARFHALIQGGKK